MNTINAVGQNLVKVTDDELACVSGGVLELMGPQMRKPGDVDYSVYVDGVLIGTTYGRLSPTLNDGGRGHEHSPMGDLTVHIPPM